MGIEKHHDFLKLYGHSMLMAVDEFPEQSQRDTDVFFDHLYEPFPQEDELAVSTAVSEADRFTVIAAPTGGGKSTIVYWALRNARNASQDYFLFDFKRRITSLYDIGQTPHEKISAINERFKETIMECFLPDLSTKLRFVFNALQLFFKNELHKLEIRWRQKHPEVTKPANADELWQLFQKDARSQEAALRMTTRKMTCAQMIECIKVTFQKEKFLLIIDNVDRFPAANQPILFSLAIDISHEGMGRFGTILCLRNKNLMRFEDAGSGGDTIEMVSITSRATEQTHPIRLRPTSDRFSTALLVRRQTYVRQLVATVADPGIRQSVRLFDELRPHVNRGMTEERFYRLSNNSYRWMLMLHLEFVRYLYRLSDHGSIRKPSGQLELDDWKLKSYMYRWMYAFHNPNHEFLLDIVGRYTRCPSKALDLPLTCDIELVLLAWLVNNRRHFLIIDDLIHAFAPLAVGPDIIREGLYRLYGEKIFHRHIELGDSEQKITREDLSDNRCRLMLTPLGAEFVQTTITKFEFLHQCLAHPEVVAIDSPEMLKPVQADVDKKISRVIKFLSLMRQVHGKTLRQFRDSWQNRDEDWETYYRRMFCIREELIMERIVRSHLTYIRNQFPPLFGKWRSAYIELLDDYLR